MPAIGNSFIEKKSPFWVALRAIILLLGLMQSATFMRSMNGDFSKPSWSFPFVMAALVALGILFIFFIQTVNPRSISKWYRPSWFRNPFNYKQPLQIFDFAAFYFLSVGFGCLFFGLTRDPTSWVWELPIAIGCGAWLGVRLCVLVFADRFE